MRLGSVLLLALFLSACGTLFSRGDDPYSLRALEVSFPRSPVYGGVAWDIRAIRAQYHSRYTDNYPAPFDIPFSFVADTLVLPFTLYEHFSQEALPLVAEEGDLEKVTGLLKGGANVDVRDRWGHTALMSAAWAGHRDIVHELLNQGAAVNAITSSNKTALQYSVWRGHTTIAKALIDRGANLGADLLGIAGYLGDVNMIQLLIEKGTDVNVEVSDGTTALMVAATYGHTSMVKLLLEKGAAINVQDNRGKTALMRAACEGHSSTVQALLERGADVGYNLTPDRGGAGLQSYPSRWIPTRRRPETALACAITFGHTKIAQMLRDAGATD